MNRIVVAVAVVALILAGVSGGYARSLSNRLNEVEDATTQLAELSGGFGDAAREASARVSDLEAMVTAFEHRQTSSSRS